MDRSRPLDAQFEARLEFDVETVSPSPGNDQSCQGEQENTASEGQTPKEGRRDAA
jgi:hypothetical protein